MLNKCCILGNLGKDPEIRCTQAGKEIAMLSVATTEKWRDKASGEQKEATEWHRVAVMNEKLVDIIRQWVRKGATVYLEGKLQTRKYEQDGVTKYATEIVLGFDGVFKIVKGNRNESSAISETAAVVDNFENEIPF